MKFTGEVIYRDLSLKREIKNQLENILGEEQVKKALADYHAKRKPRPCGLTIHTSTGCIYGCLYCYIFDMGFSSSPRPYPLSGEQLVYALLSNESFIAGPHGTLLAFGSVTEPFMDVAKTKSFEYLDATRRYLGNPQQISVKGVLSSGEIEVFARSADKHIDVLISLSTLKNAHILEPGAPKPDSRLDFAMELAKRGFNVALFIRPIIPSVTDVEFDYILREAENRGLKRIVLGALRVTRRIVERLEASRVVDIGSLRGRIPVRELTPGRQVSVKSMDIKKTLALKASSRGFKVYPSACSSSIEAHRLYCRLCGMGPCGEKSSEVVVDEGGVRDAAELLGLKVEVDVLSDHVKIACKGSSYSCEKLKLYIEAIGKIRVVWMKPARGDKVID